MLLIIRLLPRELKKCLKKPEKFLQKSLVVKKKYLPLQSQTKTGCLVAQFSGIWKFIEKTDLLYKKQVPRKTIYREALILFLELRLSGRT